MAIIKDKKGNVVHTDNLSVLKSLEAFMTKNGYMACSTIGNPNNQDNNNMLLQVFFPGYTIEPNTK